MTYSRTAAAVLCVTRPSPEAAAFSALVSTVTGADTILRPNPLSPVGFLSR